MKQRVTAYAAAIALALGAAGAGTALAAQGPSNKCYGQIIRGIASTWPWAHNDKIAFAPPPGAIALWLREFGPLVGVSSVRELQILFCGG